MRTDAPRRPRRPWLRRLWRLALATASLFALATVGIAWYYAGQIHDGALRVDHSVIYDLRVVALTSDTITLQPTAKSAKDGSWTQDGVWGIDWPGGYGRAGRILSLDTHGVTRELPSLRGNLQVGDLVRLDSFAFPHISRELGIVYPHENVSVAGPDGALPAWFLRGPSDTWLISVHGKGSSPAEVLRLWSGLEPGTYPVLAISYRNDEGAPASADGYYDYGASEWRDLEAAVKYAQAAGARHIVLVGYSMGSAIVLSFLQHSPLANSVDGLILDAPVLDFGGVIDYAATQRHLPGFIPALAKAIVSRRYGIDWSMLDYRATALSTPLPVLLFHGEADKTVPIAASRSLANAGPGRVRLETFAGAGHVRSWNLDAARYDAAVRDFLASLAK